MHLVCPHHSSRRHKNIRPMLLSREQASERRLRPADYWRRILLGRCGECRENKGRSDRRLRTTARQQASVHRRLAERRQSSWVYSARFERNAAAQQLVIRRLCDRQSRPRKERVLSLLRNAVLNPPRHLLFAANALRF